jgi:hypothetical protein
LLVGVRFIEPASSGAINVAPTVFDFWLKILMLATPNPLALGAGYPLLSSSPEYPHLYSSPLEGEDKRRGHWRGRKKGEG